VDRDLGRGPGPHRALRGPRRAPARALLLAVLALAACGERRAGAPALRANVLLVTLDTTRADRLGLYGYPRPTSPNLDLLARESLVFERAYSTSSWTLPAHASLLTGMLPTSHGANKDPEGDLVLGDAITMPESWNFYRARGLRPDVPTLATLLGDAGWETGALVGGPWLKRVFGLGRGFAFYDDEGIDTVEGRRADEITRRAQAWLRERRGPWLLFLNYFDPHGPYRPPPRHARVMLAGEPPPRGMARQWALYDAEIRFVDEQLGLLFAEIRRLGAWDATWIVVTADHGELQGEHGRFGHGLTLSEEEVRVPLVVKPPAGHARPGRVAEPVSLADVVPLLLDGLGLAVPPSVQGRTPGARTDPLLAEVSQLPAEGDAGAFRALLDGRFKLVWNSRGHHALYDLERDPREERDLSAREPDRLEALRAQLDDYVSRLPRPEPTAAGEREVDATTREALRNLGYLE
jgi:arylsulfatase A-like enzyme